MEVPRYPSIIIDNGHGFMKAGFSGEKQLPTVTIPCRDDVLLGDFVVEKVQEERLPTVNLDSLKEMWKDAIYRLKADPTECIFVLTANRLFTEKDYHAIAEIMSEEIGAEGLGICNESSFPMIWYGKRTGVYVDCGELITSVVVFHDGRRLSDNVLNFGGRDVTLKLLSSLQQNGYDQLDSQNLDHLKEIRKIKHEYGRISTDYEREMQLACKTKPTSVLCQLDPQQVLVMRNEHFACSEGLFHPHHFGKRQSGIHHAVCRAIVSQPIDKQAALYESILLCGGTTLLKSFPERLSTEIANFMKVRTPVKVIAHEGREHSVWLGANMLETEKGSTNREIFRKSQYLETGEGILRRTSRRKNDAASLHF
ncbi:actin-like [Corticium candelabrum]|uniref:actin-like n=1 Tax=Corticium candelabrum TaxID=121492 RepID=UPI002E26B9A0|nr:actin-like [Corticium candelabrum]